MRFMGYCLRALSVVCLGIPGALCLGAASFSSCTQGARTFLPCELNFDYQQNDLPAAAPPYKQELLDVEFRSPDHVTYLMHAFWDGGQNLRVRFSPTEAGSWTYRVSSAIKRYDGQESSFNVTDSGNAGMVSVANLRHWQTPGKKP